MDKAAQTKAVTDFLTEQHISDKLTAELVLTRFTSTEFAKVLSMPNGTIFTHVNLQHRGIPYELFSARIQAGVRIVEPGIETTQQILAPVLDTKPAIILRQLDFRHSLSIADPQTYTDLMLHNPAGILESLFDRYGNVLELSQQTIATMQYFDRKFEVLGQTDL